MATNTIDSTIDIKKNDKYLADIRRQNRASKDMNKDILKKENAT